MQALGRCARTPAPSGPGAAHTARDEHGWLGAFIEGLAAAVLLSVAAPVVALACLLVRLTSRGPSIYTHKRVGWHGRWFTIYKIRTMYQNSEPDGPVWSVGADPRVTPVGRILRWTHIDELPQLLNIALGDMALVGPRPERPEIVAKLRRALPDYDRRLLLRPGLTGLAQVLRGPDEDLNSVRRKLDLDLYYLEHRSLWLDLRILAATPAHVLRVPPLVIAWAFGFPAELARPREIEAEREAEAAGVGLAASPPVAEPCGAG